MRTIIKIIINYPVCLSALLLIIAAISAIIISVKAYAYYNEPGCECVNKKHCPKEIEERCVDDSITKDCTCREKYICSTPAIQECRYVGPGCGCCDDDDCNIVDEDLWGRWADGCPTHCGLCYYSNDGECPNKEIGECSLYVCIYKSWTVVNKYILNN